MRAVVGAVALLAATGAVAQPQVVQQAEALDGPITALSYPFPADNAPGNAIMVVAFWSDLVAGAQLADSQGNTYRVPLGAMPGQPAGQMQIFLAEHVDGGSNLLTLSFSATTATGGMAMLELSGLAGPSGTGGSNLGNLTNQAYGQFMSSVSANQLTFVAFADLKVASQPITALAPMTQLIQDARYSFLLETGSFAATNFTPQAMLPDTDNLWLAYDGTLPYAPPTDAGIASAPDSGTRVVQTSANWAPDGGGAYVPLGPTAAGNELFAIAFWSGGGAAKARDTSGDLFLTTGPYTSGGSPAQVQLFYAEQIRGGATWVEVDFSTGAGAGALGVAVLECSGLAGVSSLDVAQGQGGPFASVLAWTPPDDTNGSDEFAIAALLDPGAHAPDVSPEGWSSFTVNSAGLVEWRTLPAPRQVIATATLPDSPSQPNADWAMTLGVFRTGPPGPPDGGSSADAGGFRDGGAVPDGGAGDGGSLPPGAIPFANLGCSFTGAPLAAPLALLLWLARRRGRGQRQAPASQDCPPSQA